MKSKKKIRDIIFFTLILSIANIAAISAQIERDPVYDGYRKNAISDMVLMYQGGLQRPECTPDFIYPYVVHTDRFNKKDWFFDGFLFLEFNDGQGYHFEYSWDPEGKIAGKSRWEWLVNRHFEKGKGIYALNEAIKKGIQEIGEPSFKHKVVISIPEPVWNVKDWGELNGKKLDFSQREDRLAACKWYIDLIAKKFKEKGFEHIELAGIYWLNEQMLNSQNITVDIGDYARGKGLQFYWIPYYTATGFSEWYNYGFDMAYIQPTHFFNKKVKDDRPDSACKLAFAHNMGVEMEFDSDALTDSPQDKRSRLITYMESFRQNKAFENSSLAYYEGGNGIYNFSKSKNENDMILMDSLHLFIQGRKTSNASFYERFYSPAGLLDSTKWNVRGNLANIKLDKEGLVIKGNDSIDINTLNKVNFRYGKIELKVKIISENLNSNSNIRISLLPVKNTHGAWPNSGEILLMGYNNQNTYLNIGQNTEQNNELKGNMRGAICYLDSCKREKIYTITCQWQADRIFTHVDGRLIHTNENMLEPATNDYHRNFYTNLWPFDSEYYIDIKVISKSDKPIAYIQSIKVE